MTSFDFFAMSGACFAMLMMGSGKLRLNLFLYCLQTIFVAFATLARSFHSASHELYLISCAVIVIKALAVPYFLSWVLVKINVRSDPGVMVPISISMHISIVLLAISHFLSQVLPPPLTMLSSLAGVTAAISLLLTGMSFMLFRRLAISQIIGFLTMENGIFLFGVSQTKGMPVIVEMGILLDVLVAVMIAGLFVFRIKNSFEHIDVTQLNELTEN